MTRPPASPPPDPARRLLALLVAAAAAFTVVGSLVPFAFRPRPFAEVVGSFEWAMTNRAAVESRSDGLANVLLGVPLGFGLLGACRVGKPNRLGDVVVGAVLLPGCLLFAAAVEFAQLYLPGRTCAGSDVLCQGAGAAVGMIGWTAAGRWLAGHAADVWGGTPAPGRLLAAYLVLLAFVQVLPMDLTASPRDLYHKLRDQVRVVPFGEYAAAGRGWDETAKLLKLVGLYLPAGLLAARFWDARGFPRVAAAAVGLACGMEALQLVVQSRSPGATDVIAGAAGALAGWAVGRGCGGSKPLLGVVWAGVLLTAYWQPFDFGGPRRAFDWVPGMPLESGNPLAALEELVTKAVLFAPVGVLVASRGRAVAAGVGLALAAVIEGGQVFQPGHTPCVTDVLLGGCGAVAGAWAAERVRGGPECTRVEERWRTPATNPERG